MKKTILITLLLAVSLCVLVPDAGARQSSNVTFIKTKAGREAKSARKAVKKSGKKGKSTNSAKRPDRREAATPPAVVQSA